jgi:alpha-amylase
VFIQSLVRARKSHKVFASSQVQRYAADNFYAFSRGDVLVCLTNSGGSTVSITVTYLPYAVGEVVCNVLVAGDCATVTGSGLGVTLTNGLPKVYVPSSSSVV